VRSVVDYDPAMNFMALPGGELVCQRLEDQAAGHETEAVLLVLIGAPRLRRLGIEIPATARAMPEHLLYERLARNDAASAHSRYNALIRRLVSFERAAEC